MNLRHLSVFVVLGAVVGCSGGASSPVSPFRPPGTGGTTVPSTGATTSPPQSTGGTPTPGTSGALTAEQASTALENADAYYQTLPGTDPIADLATLASYMVSSGGFRSADVTPGGITATLSDGSPALVFADRQQDLTGTTSGALRTSRAPQGVGVQTAEPSAAPVVSAATGHEIAFLVNKLDNSGAFVPQRQIDFAAAFVNDGFAKAGYGVDALDVSLESIAALGNGHPLDFLDIATHGLVANKTAPYYYANLSTSPVTTAEKNAYSADYNAGRLVYAIYLTKQGKINLPTFAFTPDFVTAHVTFNPGAIVDNMSCYGQSPLIASLVQGKWQAAGVGRYFGWTKAVGGTDADETDAFLLDRLLGETNPSVTGLNRYANQRTPAQRPFPLDDIEVALGNESRNSPLNAAQPNSYTTSNGGGNNAAWPPLSDGSYARLVVSDFGGESVANPPIVYGLPSIERLAVIEAGPGGVLQIVGHLPAAQGSATVVTANGTLNPVVHNWTTSSVLIPIPNKGAALVQILSAEGIPSNAVPLTEWSGTMSYSESDTLTTLSGYGGSGSGSGSFGMNFTFAVRSDVHPDVAAIDTTPAPQNLYFSGVERGSGAGVMSSVSGSYTSGSSTGTFQLPVTPTMTPGGSSAGFDLKPLGTVPSPCDDASPGPQSGNNGRVYCPSLTFAEFVATSCSAGNSPTDICLKYNAAASGGYGPTFGTGGLLTLTLNPATWALSGVAHSATITPTSFGGGSGTANLSVTFGPPVDPPGN